jgi:hypothetical protein
MKKSAINEVIGASRPGFRAAAERFLRVAILFKYKSIKVQR